MSEKSKMTRKLFWGRRRKELSLLKRGLQMPGSREGESLCVSWLLPNGCGVSSQGWSWRRWVWLVARGKNKSINQYTTG